MPGKQDAGMPFAVAPSRGPRAHVWIVPGAEHTRGLTAAPRAWQVRVIAFLHAALHPVTEE
jgi:hypothetical protein